jgi:hypothetical protein
VREVVVPQVQVDAEAAEVAAGDEVVAFGVEFLVEDAVDRADAVGGCVGVAVW